MNPNSFRQIIAPGSDDRVVYAIEFLSQPDKTLIQRNPNITKKSERVLPVASERDVVFLSQTANREYLDWLHTIGLGTHNVFEFDAGQGQSIPNLILKDVDRVREYLSQLGGNQVMVPNYSGEFDQKAAEALGILFIGNSPDVTLRFYDKSSFKEVAERLGVPVAEGERFDSSEELTSLMAIISKYSKKYGSVVVKPVSSATGNLTYSTNEESLERILLKIRDKGDFIVNVQYPVDIETNTQWVIDREGNLHFLGAYGQEVNNLSYQGNIFPVNHPSLDAMLEDSKKIATFMRNAGYVGVFGLDAIHFGDEYVFLENNARLNGSTFARGILDRISGDSTFDAWISCPMSLSQPNSFNFLLGLTQDIIYPNRESQALFFPYDISHIGETGRFIGLFAGRCIDTLKRLHKEIETRIS